MTDERITKALAFGAVAERYDRHRPGYPAALVDDVLARAAGTLHHGALEVGAGTGKATAGFVGRGFPVSAVEPDPRMRAVLARRLAGVPDAVIVGSTFEDYRPPRPHGLLYSAQAWHWVDPAVRYERAAAALVPGGCIALFWNEDQLGDAALLEAVRAVHADHGTGWQEPEIIDAEEFATKVRTSELARRPEFADHDGTLYEWDLDVPMAGFVRNLSTKSAYLIMDRDARHRLLDAVGALAARVPLRMRTYLYMSRRR